MDPTSKEFFPPSAFPDGQILHAPPWAHMNPAMPEVFPSAAFHGGQTLEPQTWAPGDGGPMLEPQSWAPGGPAAPREVFPPAAFPNPQNSQPPSWVSPSPHQQFTFHPRDRAVEGIAMQQSAVPEKYTVSPRLEQRLRRAVLYGLMLEADLAEIEYEGLKPAIEMLADFPEMQQQAAVDRFLGLPDTGLKWVENKRAWLERCILFNPANGPENPAVPEVLKEVLEAQALTSGYLEPFCLMEYLKYPAEYQRRVADALRGSVLCNIQNLSTYFMNFCRNEKICFPGSPPPPPPSVVTPKVMQWEELDGTLYQVLLQQMLLRRHHALEHLLHMLSEAVNSPPPMRLQQLHEATAESRRESSADVTSVLHAAAAHGLTRICVRLIHEGLSVNECAGQEECTPLHLAAARGEVGCVRLLLKKAADPHIKDTEGCTPLQCAVQNATNDSSTSPYWKVFQALLEAGGTEKGQWFLKAMDNMQAAEQIAASSKFTRLRALIRTWMLIVELRVRCPEIDESTVRGLHGLQYETAVYAIKRFTDELAVGGAVKKGSGAAEFAAWLSSEQLQRRDSVQHKANRLWSKLGLQKEAVDALVVLPFEAANHALKTFTIQAESGRELTLRFLEHLAGPAVQACAVSKPDDPYIFGGQNRMKLKEDARRAEIDKLIDELLAKGTTPLDKKDFDFRVRRFLHEFSLHGGTSRVGEALGMIETATAIKNREDARSWPAYLAALLRRADPDLYEMLVERDKKARGGQQEKEKEKDQQRKPKAWVSPGSLDEDQTAEMAEDLSWISTAAGETADHEPEGSSTNDSLAGGDPWTAEGADPWAANNSDPWATPAKPAAKASSKAFKEEKTSPASQTKAAAPVRTAVSDGSGESGKRVEGKPIQIFQ
eukprot:gnl/MRDRNA2_/MRDRNA2_72875_c0_seq1.p1 gnl/MRDRNA2_/MRDRNA2_72875_c0~~gnl/MRDRNA2_/MRDRNA2_72875_c0_seq1.p1  ORF type:complete len:1035 (+),score=248.34 gnl/MRDRNA2_/MRDRNA2_72875_c0_seq1:451-3105(+)